jgi:hypothetical protein
LTFRRRSAKLRVVSVEVGAKATMEAKPKGKPMTRRQYAKSGGQTCPFCRSKDVEAAGAIMPDDRDGATLEVERKDCGRTWKDVYKLAGYEADGTDGE